MKKIAIIGFCGILALAFVATVALAWGPGFGPMFGRGFGGSANGVPPIPDLTAEQSVVVTHARDARHYRQEKERGLSANNGQPGTGDSTCETLGITPLAGDRSFAYFGNKNSMGPRNNDRRKDITCFTDT
jgi:hypothetical protein